MAAISRAGGILIPSAVCMIPGGIRRIFDLSLYLVTDRSSEPDEGCFVERVVKATQGGVSFIQLREQERDAQACIRTAQEIKRRVDLPLIINNRVDIALLSGADGVHLGCRDITPRQARAILGEEAIVGQTLHRIEDVELGGADVDYFGVQVFPSNQTKRETDKIWGLSGLAEIRRRFPEIKIVAIGGITRKNTPLIAEVLKEGDGIAVVGEIWRDPDPFTAAQRLRHLFIEGRGQ